MFEGLFRGSLGAGANQGATNAKGRPLRTGAELETLLRKETHLSDTDMSLGDLVDEYRNNVGDPGLTKLFQDEFGDCSPSEDQKLLLQYTWHRLYTLNIDDALEKTPRHRRAQTLKSVNRTDSVEERRNFDYLEIVHLNGYIGNQDAGFVFTPAQYRAEIKTSSTWYTKCGVDFVDKVFVFIGTKLDEPIFDAHVEEISRNRGKIAARSFLVTPAQTGDFRKRKLGEKKIQIVEGTLRTFLDFLRTHVGETLIPNEVAALISGQPLRHGFSSALVASVEQVGTTEWISRHRLNEAGHRRFARDFLQRRRAHVANCCKRYRRAPLAR